MGKLRSIIASENAIVVFHHGAAEWAELRHADSVYLRITFVNKRKRADCGVIWEKIELKNQNDETLSEAEHAGMLLRRGPA